ncbi:PAS/PAC sensor signal transduction histidine kinase [Mucilaginibacter yixingensis]|uniref:histidine kinase n=1 Tax=Mucilaginibacter yixingensis TaxID=1295612 RepID=A0A2T5JDC4_9SPHI|nr:ATP-binding protein [Mucilaginibacter yixingensis]PTQ99768.1 PAS/PAC sensor signal transduction histidine kinase [Mucilaginibacter yixingensis]
MKVKNKLRLGFGFLFVIVLFFGALSIFFVNQIAGSGKVILKDNYESLTFAREMRTVLDNNSLPLNNQAKTIFEQQLVKEEHNITEPGEGEAARAVRAGFMQLINPATTPQARTEIERQIRKRLRDVEEVNMRGIVRKNDQANRSVDKTIILLGLAGTFTFLVLFSFSVNFPSAISNPLNALLRGIRQISQQNYQERIHFEQNDEFAEVANAFNDMAARLKEWENSNLSKIMSEKQRIDTIIEQMQDAIIGVNEQQQVLFINTSAKRMLNLSDDKFDGEDITQIARHNDLLKSIIESESVHKPFRVVVNGKDAFFQLDSTEITVPNISPGLNDTISFARKSAGRVYILRNVTEFKERDEAKTNFIATISHELKTPISAIKMSLKLLHDQRVGGLNKEQEELVNHIGDDAERLLKITYELLDLSQVETGNIQLNFIPAKPEQILNYAVKAVKSEAGQKKVTIEELLPASLPNVHADVEKTAWVMINFLSNALRYSPDKSKIVIKVMPKGQFLEFSVQDFGKGIEAQYQERLFDRYFQVPTDGQNKSGSGLGLAISKEFILAQGGQIGLESEMGSGSRFYFTLPLAKA